MVNFYFICPLLLFFGLLEAQRHNSFGVPSLRLDEHFKPRDERATLLQLGDQASKKVNSSSYSYLLSLGKGEMLSTIFQRGKNKIPKAPEKQSILSGTSGGAEHMDA